MFHHVLAAQPGDLHRPQAGKRREAHDEPLSRVRRGERETQRPFPDGTGEVAGSLGNSRAEHRVSPDPVRGHCPAVERPEVAAVDVEGRVGKAPCSPSLDERGQFIGLRLSERHTHDLLG